MRNKTDKLEKRDSCFSCSVKGVYCDTPSGGEYTTCPLCSDIEYQYVALAITEKITAKDYHNYDDLHKIPFCEECMIVYRIGCVHAVNGCTDNCYNGHFIGKWKDTTTNTEYVGMPQFDSIEEWDSMISKIEILEWICPGGGAHCTGGYYPKRTHPQYYSKCSLRSSAE